LLAGHGGDAATLCATAWQDWRESAREALQGLARRVDSVFVAGICVGGLLGLHLALSERRIRGVALYSPGLGYDGWNMPRIFRWSRLGLPLLARLPIVRTCGIAEPGALESFPFAALHEGNRFFRDVRRRLRQTSVPLLVVQARQDDICSARHAERIARAVRGPCRVVYLEDSYHLVHLDQERGRVTRLTSRFFLEQLESCAERRSTT
jgi:carboxylesterase